METQYEGPLIAIISPPGSPLRAAWELLGACLILYDLIYIPLGASASSAAQEQQPTAPTLRSNYLTYRLLQVVQRSSLKTLRTIS